MVDPGLGEGHEQVVATATQPIEGHGLAATQEIILGDRRARAQAAHDAPVQRRADPVLAGFDDGPLVVPFVEAAETFIYPLGAVLRRGGEDLASPAALTQDLARPRDLPRPRAKSGRHDPRHPEPPFSYNTPRHQ